MSKILAIDFGQKRVGLAITDENQLIASALTTVHSKDIFSFLKDFVATETVECIVVGEAKNLDGTPSESSRFIEPFVKRLNQEFDNIKIERIDERFTSKMAFQSMIRAGLNKKSRRDKSIVDKISATIILQSYLESRL